MWRETSSAGDRSAAAAVSSKASSAGGGVCVIAAWPVAHSSSRLVTSMSRPPSASLADTVVVSPS